MWVEYPEKQEIWYLETTNNIIGLLDSNTYNKGLDIKWVRKIIKWARDLIFGAKIYSLNSFQKKLHAGMWSN